MSRRKIRLPAERTLKTKNAAKIGRRFLLFEKDLLLEIYAESDVRCRAKAEALVEFHINFRAT